MAEQLEQESDVKRLQLSAERGAIAFQAKQRECDSLLQLNREVHYIHHTSYVYTIVMEGFIFFYLNIFFTIY